MSSGAVAPLLGPFGQRHKVREHRNPRATPGDILIISIFLNFLFETSCVWGRVLILTPHTSGIRTGTSPHPQRGGLATEATRSTPRGEQDG